MLSALHKATKQLKTNILKVLIQTVLANALNYFYSRFDVHDFSKERQGLSQKLKDTHHFEIGHMML